MHTELARIVMVPLRAPIKHAFEAYGDPTESYPDEDHPESIFYVFEPDDLYRVVIIEWKGLVHSVTY